MLLHGNVRSFVSDATWYGSCFFGGFVWEHVVPLKSLLLLRDVTGEALFSSAVAWFCIEMESVVTPLIVVVEPSLGELSPGLPGAVRSGEMHKDKASATSAPSHPVREELDA